MTFQTKEFLKYLPPGMFGNTASILFSDTRNASAHCSPSYMDTCTSKDPQKTTPHVKITPLYLHENILNILSQYCRAALQSPKQMFQSLLL